MTKLDLREKRWRDRRLHVRDRSGADYYGGRPPPRRSRRSMPSAASPMTKYMTINGRLPNVTLHEDLLKLPPLVTCRVWGVKEARDKRHKYRNGRNRRKGALSTSGFGCRTDDGRNNKLCNGHGGRNSRVLGAMENGCITRTWSGYIYFTTRVRHVNAPKAR